MKTLLLLVCLLVVTALAAQTIVADIAKPKPAEKPIPSVMHRNLDIVPDKEGYSAVLQLSRSDVAELRAALDIAPTNTIAARIAYSSTRTIVAGLLLFVSVSFGGVWLAQSSTGRTRKAVGAAILVGAVLGVAAIITRANAGPPPRNTLVWTRLSKNLSQGRTTSGSLVIEILADDPNNPPNMRLLIPVDPTHKGDDE
jgi:hypothetical protein